jgi:hypothetical protein
MTNLTTCSGLQSAYIFKCLLSISLDMAIRGEEDMRGQKESEQQVFHGNVSRH